MKKGPSKLVLNRDYMLATTKGHMIAFKKNVPVYVPPVVYADAIAIGARPEDGSDPNVLGDESSGKVVPMDTAERGVRILAALERIVARNERKDFTAAGSPSVRAVEHEVGFDVDMREVTSVMQERNEKRAAQ